MSKELRPLLVRYAGPTLVAMLLACSGSDSASDARSGAPLPRLVERPQVPTVDASLRGTNAAFVLSPSGSVAFAARLASGNQVVVIDSLGNPVHEFGPEGDGPGEVKSPLPFHLDEGVLRVVDLQGLRVTTWMRRSDSVSMTQLVRPILPQAEVSSHWLGLDVTEDGLVPVYADAGDVVEWRPLPRVDPLVDSILDAASARGDRPGVALDSDGFIVADGVSYRLAVVDREGMVVRRHHRSLAPNLPTDAEVDREVERLRGLTRNGQPRYDEARIAAIADSFRTTPRPWFSVSASGMHDNAGRLWVIGSFADSVFADVFDAEGFIGRQHLACPEFAGRWAVNRAWLALACAPPDSSVPVDAVVRLFRILD